MGFIESFSVTVLVKSIPEASEEIFLNKVELVCRQEIKTETKAKKAEKNKQCEDCKT